MGNTQGMADSIQTRTQAVADSADHMGKAAQSVKTVFKGNGEGDMYAENVSAYGGIFGGDHEADGSRKQMMIELTNYLDSKADKFKTSIIRGMAKALKNEKVGDIDPNADLSVIVKQMRKAVPDPNSSRAMFINDSKTHASACKALAGALNAQFTPGKTGEKQLIRIDMGPEYICRHVAKIVHSMASGIRMEFLEVQSGLRESLTQLAALTEYLQASNDKTIDIFSKDALSETMSKAKPYTDVADRILNEIKIITLKLENYLDITMAPADILLKGEMGKMTSFYESIKQLHGKPGSSDFGKAIHQNLDSLGLLASITERSNSALKLLGMGLKQYKGLNTIADLDRIIDNKHGSLEIEKAKQLLRRNFLKKDDISEVIEGSSMIGGADVEPKTQLDRRVARRKEERKLILQQYLRSSRRAYDKLLSAIKEIGPQLGSKIPVTVELDGMRDALSRLHESPIPRLDLSLIGFYTSAAARSKRDNFLGLLSHLKNSVDSAVASETYATHSATIKPVGDAIQDLIDTIDSHAKIVSDKYGGDDDMSLVDGGDEVSETISSELKLAEQNRSTLDIKSAVNDFLYYFYVAKVRENLKTTSKEIQQYDNKYEEIVGDATASRIQQLEKERDAILEEKGSPTANCLGAKPYANPTGPAEETANARWEGARDSIILEFKTKIDFYQLVQAIDLYMKAFSKGIASDPDAVLDIKKQLGGMETLGKWFTDLTGDNLTKFFDMSRAVGGTVNDSGNIPTVSGEQHYYDVVSETLTSREGTVGGGGAVSVDMCSNMRQTAGKVLNNFQALKNMMNGFTRLGAKFGGAELLSETFMTPVEMYANMLRYLKVSSISTRVRPSDSQIPDGPLSAMVDGGRLVEQAKNIADGSTMCYITPAKSQEGGFISNWDTENHFFQFIIKCVAAKILVVLGIFDLFERPEPIYKLTPTRMILGGYDKPEVVAAATELYFRLPRLAEFYLDLFDFKDSGILKISMLPEVEGVFSGLISQIFVRANKSASTGDYSNTETQELIGIINQIYDHYSNLGEQGTQKALEDFVSEINRRYGILKQSEWDKMQNILNETRYNAPEADLSESTNYAILPDEDEVYTEYDRKKLAPSDHYLAPRASTMSRKWAPGKFTLDTSKGEGSMWKVLEEFRNKLSVKLTPDKTGGDISYRSLITQAKQQIEKSNNSDEKIEVVYRLIQGSSLVTGTDQGRSLMFHETVVLGLNTLTALHDQLKEFRSKVNLMDVNHLTNEAVKLMAAPAPINSGLFSDQTYIRRAGLTRLGMIFPDDHVLATSANTLNSVWTYCNGADCGAGAPNTPITNGNRIAISRIIINRHKIMTDLINTVFELSSDFDEMVTIRYPGTMTSKIHIDFSKLRETTEGLITNVRKYLNKFRGSMSADTIKRFEGQTTARGTLAWVEQELIEGLLQGRRTSGGKRDNDASTLDDVSTLINKIFVELTVEHKSVVKLDTLAGASTPPTSDGEMYDQYGNEMGAMIHWRQGRPTGVGTTAMNSKLQSLITGPRLPTAGAGTVNPPLQDTTGNPITQRSQFYGNVWSDSRSLMMSFNQLMAMYLSKYFDSPTSKIYQGLIDSFANGSFSQAVMMPGYSQPDIYSQVQDFGVRGDPTGRSVLLTSLATVLQRMVSDRNAQGISMYLQSTMAEVPMYIKEDFRATLPVFRKMFDLLNKRGSFIKRLIQMPGGVRCGRINPTVHGAITPGSLSVIGGVALVRPGFWPQNSVVDGVTLHPIQTGANENTNDKVRPIFVDIIDSITNGCYTMTSITQNVLRELADEPSYLQTSADSIQDYKARFNTMPLMPLSLSLTYLRDVTVSSPALLPIQGVGSPEFRMLYGVRGIFSSEKQTKTSLERLPGVKSILAMYNNGTVASDNLDESGYVEFVSQVICSIRYLIDTRSYKAQLINSTDTYALTNLLVGDDNKMLVYSLRSTTTLPQTLEIVDSSSQSEKISDITKSLTTSGNAGGLGTDRSLERRKNIIDMNIMPINIHALMRSMALSETYNYGYTFEELACIFFGESRSRISKLKTDVQTHAGDNDAPKSSKQFFLKLLIDPYADISESQYGDGMTATGTDGFIQRICRGDDDLVLGRPKFISDQLFNKVMFGSIYPSKSDHDESGPGGQAARGRADWQNQYTAERVPTGGPASFKQLLAVTAPIIAVYKSMSLDKPSSATRPTVILDIGNKNSTTYMVRVSKLAVDAVKYINTTLNIVPADLKTAALDAVIELFPGITYTNTTSFLNSAGAASSPVTAAEMYLNSAGLHNPANTLSSIKQYITDNGTTVNSIYNLWTGTTVLPRELVAIARGAVDWRVYAVLFGTEDSLITSCTTGPSKLCIMRVLTEYMAKKLSIFNTINQRAIVKIGKTVTIAAIVTGTFPNTPRRGSNMYNNTTDPRLNSIPVRGSVPGSREGVSTTMTYIGNNQDNGINNIKEVPFLVPIKQQLVQIGKERFDSLLVRNLFFITNVNRIIRQKLSVELAQQRTIIQRGDDLVSASLTEYGTSSQSGRDETAKSFDYFSERTMM